MPSDPVTAVVHPDPYPYYAALVAERPLARDERLGMWVAASAAAVTGVLTSPRGRVRPPAEPVPAALTGSPAGEIFGRLVRMTDGEGHDAMKHAVSAALEPVDAGRLTAVSRERARALVETLAPHAEPARVTPFAFRLVAEVVATLLGAAPDALPHLARATEDFVRALAPGSPRDQLERGKAAAAELLAWGRSWRTTDGLLASLAGHASHDPDGAVANALGFLSQAYEATAGLIGNTLVALAREPDLRQAVPAVVLEVLRHDPPVQNTRRFVAEDGEVAGVPMAAGDAALVVLAAANHDPAVNPDPTRFDVTRVDPSVFTFGVGPHACPGTMIATTIAVAGVQTLLAAGVEPEKLVGGMRYRPSVNTRVPLFGAGSA